MSGFHFSLKATRGEGRRWALQVRHEKLGQPDAPAAVEFARRPLVVAPQHLRCVTAPIHRAYGFEMPTLPVISEPEACAEKLARYRRVRLGRDVYDLAQFAGRPLDEPLVRRLWVLKVWGDVVDDGRGHKPLDPADVLTPRKEVEFAPDSIGKLTRPVDIPAWERRFRERFSFLAALDADEHRWVACDPRHRAEIEAAICAGGFP